MAGEWSRPLAPTEMQGRPVRSAGPVARCCVGSGLDGQRALLHPPDRSWDVVWHEPDSLEHGHAIARLGVRETDRLKRLVAPLTPVRGFANQEASTVGQEASGTLNGLCWGTKSSTGHHVIQAPVVRVMSGFFRPRRHNIDSIFDAQFHCCPDQESGALRRSIKKDTGHVRGVRQQGNTGKTATGAEVDEARRVGGNQ